MLEVDEALAGVVDRRHDDRLIADALDVLGPLLGVVLTLAHVGGEVLECLLLGIGLGFLVLGAALREAPVRLVDGVDDIAVLAFGLLGVT